MGAKNPGSYGGGGPGMEKGKKYRSKLEGCFEKKKQDGKKLFLHCARACKKSYELLPI